MATVAIKLSTGRNTSCFTAEKVSECRNQIVIFANIRKNIVTENKTEAHSKIGQEGLFGSPSCRRSSYFGGRRGIRTPGTLQFNGFQDRRDRPLRHPSGHKSSTDFPFRQIFTPIYRPYRRTENQIRTIIFVFIRNLHIFVSELGPRGYFLHATML